MESIIFIEMQTCPYCRDRVDGDAIECPACGTPHHQECWIANEATCSVFGCDSRSAENLLGCPWCDEVYPANRINCMVCNAALMSPPAYLEFLNRYEWEPLPLNKNENPLLTAGYLRNHGLVVRMQKRAPISMFGLRQPAKLWVAYEDQETSKRLLAELSESWTRCIICGHVISRDERDCSFCVESTGAEA